MLCALRKKLDCFQAYLPVQALADVSAAVLLIERAFLRTENISVNGVLKDSCVFQQKSHIL